MCGGCSWWGCGFSEDRKKKGMIVCVLVEIGGGYGAIVIRTSVVVGEGGGVGTESVTVGVTLGIRI